MRLSHRLLAAWCGLASLLAVCTASAESPERRPGLWGSVSSRRMTMPLNSLGLILGPGQTPLFGQRYGDNAPDGGVGFESPSASGDDQIWLRGGVVFGLSPQLEAGALFLTFRAAPDFHYSNFPVYITYHWNFDNVDVGAKFSFLTPVEVNAWSFNPGAPVLIRFDKARIDTGLFLPILTNENPSLGINIPLRGTYNLTPRWFIGAESGLYEAAFGSGDGLSSPLGAFVGYTTLVSSRIVDFSARFNWSEFLRYDPTASQESVDVGAFQLFAGATFHSKVM